MGSAMLTRWREKMPAGISDFVVVASSKDSIPQNLSPRVVVLAVKPQQLEAVLPEYKKRFGSAPLYISIAAGKRLEFFAKHLGDDARVIRTMPNTPAQVGKAVTAMCANSLVNDKDKEIAKTLMNAIGISLWLEENKMDGFTALAGSGPAYVFLFLEALAKAGLAVGLEEGVAKTIALEMVHGSIHLAAKSQEDFATLRKNVTSKGGTTEAALDVLMGEDALEKLVETAVLAAAKRAEILAKQ